MRAASATFWTGSALAAAISGNLTAAWASETTSFGYVYDYDYRIVETVAIDEHTRISARIEGSDTLVYDQQFQFQGYDSAQVQAGIADAMAALTFAGGGNIVIFGPVFIEDDYQEVLEDVFYQSSNYVETSTVTSTQETLGIGHDTIVLTGDRGDCFSSGKDGPTNFDSMTGQFADCSGGDETIIPEGEINTNVHTNYVLTDVSAEYYNYDYAYYSHYQFIGHLQAVGYAHSLAAHSAFQTSQNLLDLLAWEPLGIRPAGSPDSGPIEEGSADPAGLPFHDGFSGWVRAFGQRHAVGLGAGAWSHRDGGIAGGATAWSPGGLGVGFSGGYSVGSAALRAGSEQARLESAFAALSVGYRNEGGFVMATILRGWHDVNGRREPAPGMVTEAAYRPTTLAGQLHIGAEIDIGPATFTPSARLRWLGISIPAFTETGTLPIVSPGYRTSMTDLTLGLGVAHEAALSGGGTVRFSLNGEFTHVLRMPGNALPLQFAGGGGVFSQPVAALERNTVTAGIGLGFFGMKGRSIEASLSCGLLRRLCGGLQGGLAGRIAW